MYTFQKWVNYDQLSKELEGIEYIVFYIVYNTYFCILISATTFVLSKQSLVNLKHTMQSHGFIHITHQTFNVKYFIHYKVLIMLLKH